MKIFILERKCKQLTRKKNKNEVQMITLKIMSYNYKHNNIDILTWRQKSNINKKW